MLRILGQYLFSITLLAVSIHTDAPQYMLSCMLAAILCFHRAKESFLTNIFLFSLFALRSLFSKYVRKLTFFAFIIRIWRELNSIFVVVFFSLATFFFCVLFDYGVPIWNGIVSLFVCKCVFDWGEREWVCHRVCCFPYVHKRMVWWRWLTMSCLFHNIKYWYDSLLAIAMDEWQLYWYCFNSHILCTSLVVFLVINLVFVFSIPVWFSSIDHGNWLIFRHIFI